MAAHGPSSWLKKATAILAEGEGFDVFRGGARTLLSVHGPWKPQLVKVAREYQVDCLELGAAALTKRTSLKLLLDLPRLRELHVVISDPTDLRPIASLSELLYLGL